MATSSTLHSMKIGENCGNSLKDAATPDEETTRVVKSCPHFQSTAGGNVCDHCNEAFCDFCKARHLELLKATIQQMAATLLLEDGHVSSLEAKWPQFERTISEHSRNLKGAVSSATDSAVATVMRLLVRCKRQTKRAIKEKTEQTSQRVRSIFEQLINLGEIEAIKRGITADSQDLKEVSALYETVVRRAQMLKIVEIFDDFGAHPFFEDLHVDELVESVKKLKLNAADMLLMSSAEMSTSEMSLASSSFQCEAALTPLPLQRPNIIDYPTATDALFDEPLALFPPPLFIHPHPPIPNQVVDFNERGLESHLTKIPVLFKVFANGRNITSTSLNDMVFLLTKSNSILEAGFDGKLHRVVRTILPADVKHLEIFDITADNNAMIFCTAMVTDNNNREKRAIVCYQTKSASNRRHRSNAIQTIELVVDEGGPHFRGIAFSDFNRVVLTALGNELLLYSVEEALSKGKKARIIDRIFLGPDIGVLTVNEVNVDLMYATVTCGLLKIPMAVKLLKNSQVQFKSLFNEVGPLQHLKGIRRNNFALAGSIAFVLIGDTIYRYEDFPSDPFLKCWYKIAQPGDATENYFGIVARCVRSREAIYCHLAILCRNSVKMFRTVD